MLLDLLQELLDLLLVVALLEVLDYKVALDLLAWPEVHKLQGHGGNRSQRQ